MRTPASPRSAQHAPPSLFCADHYRRPSALRLSPPRRAPSRTGRPDASELGYGLSTVELLGDDSSLDGEGDDLFAAPASSLGALLRRSGGGGSATLSSLVRGPLSLGSLLEQHGYATTPSASRPTPVSEDALLHALRGARRHQRELAGDHYAGQNYSDVYSDDGIDDGNGPAPVRAAGSDSDSDSASSSGSPDSSSSSCSSSCGGVYLSSSDDDDANTPPSNGGSPSVSTNRRVRRRLALSCGRHPPYAERDAEYDACEGMAAGRPSWEAGASSPGVEEYTSVGVGEEGEYGVFEEGVVDDDL